VHEPRDGALVRQVLAGDTNAYARLVTGHRERLYRFAARMLGSREDAEEAVQDAFVRAFRALRRCRDPEHFGGWVFRILANRCRSHGRRRGRYEATFVADPIALARARDPALPASEIPEWSATVQTALAALRPEQREAFLLKYVEELSYEEMARLLGVSVSALKMRVSRAAGRLRDLLGDEERG
jgi:RNA polymerase sigma-70 factor (ECF subfamily)